MKKRIIKGCAWALALFTAVSVLSLRRDTAYGAVAVEVKREDCSITFSLPANGTLPNGKVNEKYFQYYEELSKLLVEKQLTVDLYRVADVTVSGRYETVDAFDDLKKTFKYQITDDGILFPGDKGYDEKEAKTSGGLTAVSSATSAEEWSALAKKADVLKGLPTRTEQIGETGMAIENLKTGMYLVCVQPEKSTLYEYGFVPFLISLPNNYFYSRPDGTGNDTWEYQTEVGLKPERTDRYGRLRITKDLTDFNVSLGTASFIFEVKAEKDNKVVYSDVIQMDFTEAGTPQSVTIGSEKADGVDVIGKIPADSRVTVTEAYSGSSYAVTAGSTEPVAMRAYEEDGDEVEVSFTNAYNNGINGGSSVVNHFKYTESENGNGGNWKYEP